MGLHSRLINCIQGTLKINKSDPGIWGAIQSRLLLKEFQATQARSAHLALLRPEVLNRDSLRLLVWSSLWLFLTGTGSRGCVSLPTPSYRRCRQLQLRIPIQTCLSDQEGVGMANSQKPWNKQSAAAVSEADSSWPLATVFSSQLGYRRQCTAPPSNSSSQNNPVPATGVCWF